MTHSPIIRTTTRRRSPHRGELVYRISAPGTPRPVVVPALGGAL